MLLKHEGEMNMDERERGSVSS